MNHRAHAIAIQAAIAAEGRHMIPDPAAIEHIVELSDRIRVADAKAATAAAEVAAKAAVDAALKAKLAEDEAILKQARLAAGGVA